jgi:hypothetical protein
LVGLQAQNEGPVLGLVNEVMTRGFADLVAKAPYRSELAIPSSFQHGHCEGAIEGHRRI